MTVEVRPFRIPDAAAHCAGEDELIVRWLTGGYGDVEGTIEYFEWLYSEIEAGARKRPFGVWLDGQLCGYIDYNPDTDDGIEPDHVNVSYAVHPWARGKGIAVEAVGLVCELLREGKVGRRAAIRVEPENARSVRVAEKAGFTYVRDFISATDTDPDGSPRTLSLYVLDL
ncbi:MAG: GNAT family N-acetyltransferase [Nocardioidaceae bacterium]